MREILFKAKRLSDGAWVEGFPYWGEYSGAFILQKMESIRVRKAQLLERLAKEYDGTYRQVLQAHATKELTGEYLLPLPYIGEKTYSAQEIGEKLGISANKVGMLANRNHLKTKQYGAWVNDVAKNCPGKEVPSFRYYESVVPVLKTIISKQ